MGGHDQWMNDPALRSVHAFERLVLAASVAVLLALFAISIAVAQGDLGGKLRSGRDIRVPATETVATDLYVAAGTVTVDGTVQGDLVVTSGTATLNGTVDGDVLAAGGTIRVGGTVGGDVRAAGGQVVVAGSVGEDALLTGGQVELAAGGTIGEDLIVAGGRVTVAGDVTGQRYRRGRDLLTDWAGRRERRCPDPADAVAVRPDAGPGRRRDSPLPVGHARRPPRVVAGPRFMAVAEGAIRRRPLEAAGWGLGGFLGFFVLLIVIPLITVLVALVLGLLGFLGLRLRASSPASSPVLGLILAFGLAGFFLGDAVLGLALALLVAPTATSPQAAPGGERRC